MINSEELLYVVDEFDTPIKPLPRRQVFKLGHWRRCAHVWIINQKGEVLCQKRSSKKDISPGLWEVGASGHLSPGDNYFTGAVREVNEETGLNIDPTDLNLLKIYKAHEYKEFRGIFFCKLDLDLNKIKKEEEEVEEVKFIHVDVLKKHLLNDKNNAWIHQDYEREMFSVLN